MAHLNYTQRQEIQALLETGISKSEIARRLGVHRATVSREILRNRSTDGKYIASQAEQKKEVRRYVANKAQKGICKGIHLSHKYPKLLRQKNKRFYQSPMLSFFETLPNAQHNVPVIRYRVELRAIRWDSRGYRSLKSSTRRFIPFTIHSRMATNKISVIKRSYRKWDTHPFAGRRHQVYWLDYRHELMAFQYYGMKLKRRTAVTLPKFLHQQLWISKPEISISDACETVSSHKKIA
ncbi:helix-turn-helix domain-containing protein [Limibacter armeniacum]|uniref:helix-turn-helix domain-containing protein n=1 Tax=Limibacter armeniacum TaxID=466084 RepID=UPI002FE55CC9